MSVRPVLRPWNGLIALSVLGASAPAQDANPTLEERVAALEAKSKEKNALALFWKDGLRLESESKDFELRIGGRVQFDAFFGDADADAESTTGATLEDGVQARRARLALSGRLYQYFDFKWEYDFSDKDSKAKLTDVWAGISGVAGMPWIRAGHMKEPVGLETMASANDLTFMERALPGALVPFRNVGVLVGDAACEERLTWSAGVFRDTNDNGYGQADGAWAVTARVTGLPWTTAKKDHLIHLGLSASRRAPPADEVHFKSKPEANLAPDFLDTTKLGDVDAETLIGTEVAVLLDRLSLQGEWIRADLSRGSGSRDATFAGWYSQIAWTLTGEPRRYKAADGALGSPKPAKNLFEDGGIGAWELAARLSQLDLEDGGVTGGELRDVTLAVNWYLNPVVRVSLNAIKADLDRAPDDGSAKILEMRLQMAF